MIPPNLGSVRKAVVKVWDIDEDYLLGRARHTTVCQARMVAMYLSHELAGASYPEIGRAFGRHHTTVIGDCHRCKALLETDKLLVARVMAATDHLRLT